LASDCFAEYEIESIGNGFQRGDASEEYKPEESEIVEVLKDVIPVWEEYVPGLKYPKERRFTTLRYKGEELLHEYLLHEEQRFAWRLINDEMNEELYQYFSKNVERYLYVWDSFSWDYGIYSVDSRFFMAVRRTKAFFDEEEHNYAGDGLVVIKEGGGSIRGEIDWRYTDSGEPCVNIKSKKLREYQATIEAAVRYLHGKGIADVRAMKGLEADKTKKEHYTEKLAEDKKIYEKKKKRRKRIEIVLMIVFFPITIVVGCIYYFFFRWLFKVIGKMG